MSRKVSQITLRADAENSLKELLKGGELPVRTFKRVQILLDWQTEHPKIIYKIRGVSLATVCNIRTRYLLNNDYRTYNLLLFLWVFSKVIFLQMSYKEKGHFFC